MRLTIKYLTLFLLCTFFTCAQAESFKLSYETISASEIEKNPKYQNLKKFDPGHHQTIIKIHGLPEAESYILKWERPLLIKSLWQREYTKEVFTRLKDFLVEDELLLFTSSRGFMPGERVIWTLETQDGASISEKIEFTPHPIVLEAPKEGVKLHAELVNLKPAYYAILIEGIEAFEKLKLRSLSSGEKIEDSFLYTQKIGLLYTPDVIGKKGGVCDLTLTRQKGTEFRLHLPWGEELIEYLNGSKDPIIFEFTAIKK
ncbi:MAG: hypothetical protein H6620_08930 [Halobacteriovoraceae bacterium]|nr:hypothetical protein [Halobacteriovoraceae bacterium]